ncbi:response regulator transcription factor [Clostridium hydrogenum]|uniref:response regulator transcription factor n=1 Tax=Clostridium hydrogenum TaxID=2855764 RepID=UPI001F3A13BD|nr:response regulator transcription factor [Clostridium hydrogenum]
MFRILLVEDDESLAMGIEFTLEEEGYKVFRAGTLEEGKRIFETEALDLIILDVNLPDGSGYDLCKSIRAKSEIPIMFLTALDEEVNIVLGLEIGGDDYMTKPFGVREFLSRIKVLIRRNKKNHDIGTRLVSGDVKVDTATAVVTKGENKVVLTAQEYKLLLIFMNKSGVLLKRSEILKELTEDDEVFFDENTLSVYIKRIREKIEEDDKKPKYIITKRGLGYMWNKPVLKEK